MADIDNAQVIKFTNEVLRPLSDAVVGFKALLDAETVTYTQTIAPALVAFADGDIVLDGSATDGRTPISKADIAAAIAVLAAINAVIDAGSAEAEVSKPHVNVRLP